MDYKKEFVAITKADYPDRHLSEVLRDFAWLSKCSLANSVYQSEKIEKQFADAARQYKSTSGFAQMLAILVEALEANPEQDFLGEIYMESEMGNKNTGQVFTPYVLSKTAAALTFSKEDTDKAIAAKGFIEIDEPACGCGSMAIAWRNVLAEAGYGSFDCLFHATDVDRFCYAATYVQLSLLGVCGLIHHANTLSRETYESLYTPVTFASPKFSLMTGSIFVA